VSTPRVALPLLLSLATVACGARPPTTTTPDEVVRGEEIRIVAGADDDELALLDAEGLFDLGTEAVRAGRCDEGATIYERLLSSFPGTRYRSAALYNLGYCHQQAGEPEAAATRYEELLEDHFEGRDGRHGALQLLAVQVALERHGDQRALARRVLLREDLDPVERMEAMTRLAQALLGLGEAEEAERAARGALRYYRTRRGEEEIGEPELAAVATFVLAESLRLRSEALGLPGTTVEAVHQALDARSDLLLEAQRRYFDTIRLAAPEWAAAAGYRIGGLYDRLWHDMMSAPVPPPTREQAVAEEDLPVYEAEYRAELARYIRPLMRHAIRYWELTLTMVERMGVDDTDWARRTRDDLERMRQRLLEDLEPVDEEAGAPAAPRASDPA
jgi:tetratricopeptide (TPR) repeat protein